MPKPLLPHKSYGHRLACLSLYRALLKQCAAFPIPNPESGHGSSNTVHTLQCLVRYRFYKDRTLCSPSAIATGLTTGTKILTLLHQCSLKSPSALAELSTLISSASVHAQNESLQRACNASFWTPPPPHRHAHMAHHRHLSRKDIQQSTPDNPVIFQHPRPLASLKGTVRRVPHYIVSNGIPLLRYPGPQPALLNRIIKQKWKWDYKNLERVRALEEVCDLAKTEDIWDHILKKQFGIVAPGDEPQPATQHASNPTTYRPINDKSGGNGRDESNQVFPTWLGTVKDTIVYLNKAFRRQQRQRFDMGKRLFKVYEAERDMKEEERRAAKHERRMARKKALGLGVDLSAGVDEGAGASPEP